MALDPEEFVILEDHGPMTLRSAVARAMILPPEQRCHASILRQGQPWLLNFDEIKQLARRWDGGPYPLEDSDMAAGAFRLWRELASGSSCREQVARMSATTSGRAAD